MLKLLLALLTLIPPEPSAWIAATLVGDVAIAPALVKICKRETSDGKVCIRKGIHERDAWISANTWYGQTALGSRSRALGRDTHLDRRCQPKGKGDQWATRGSWGLNAGSHWEYMPRCYKPEWFDAPIVSAYVAAQKYLRRCLPKRTRKWCGKKSWRPR